MFRNIAIFRSRAAVLSSAQTRAYSSSPSMIEQILSDIANDAQKKSPNTSPKPATTSANSANISLKPVFTNTNKKRITFTSKPASNRYQNTNNNHNRRPRRANQQDRLEFQNGTERLRQLFLMVYKQIKENNHRGEFLEISPDKKGLVKTDVKQLLRNLNLDEEGIEFVQVDPRTSLPLIKRVPLQKAGEIYSDYLHEQMTKDSGLELSRKNLKRDTGDSNTKQYKLNWNLSLNDLSNVKLKEIANQLKVKNCKVEIYLADKRDLRNVGPTFIVDESQQSDESPVPVKELDDINRIKREKLVETVNAFVEEQGENNLKIDMTIRGSINNRMLILMKLDPKQAAVDSGASNDTALTQDDKKKLKEQKKLERRERERQKLLRKQQL